MKRKLISAVLCASMAASTAAVLPVTSSAAQVIAARQMEYLDRGTVAVKVRNGVFLSWRLLGTESYSTAFDVYCDGSKITTIKDSTNYTDTKGTVNNKYTVVPAGESVSSGKSVSVLGNQYMTIDITPPDPYTEDDGTVITYSANDASCGDLDGDGDYEIILKWDPSGSFDSGETKHSGYSGKVYIDAYDIEKNERLWRMDLGKNISAGAHFTQFAVYDFDLDGKAEIAYKTAPGSKDGLGNYVTAASSVAAIKNKTNADNEKDLRASTGRILQGDEYYTVFDGETGAALDTIYYPVPRGTIKNWGDSYGGRADRFLTSVAYLDGVTPSVITWRGYYTRTTATAYNLVNKKLVEIARFDSDTYSGPNSDMNVAAQGNHNTTVGDVDYDGREEILCGGLCLGYENNDFVVQWTTETGHGDALHLADYDPTHERMEYFIVHEESPYGMSVVDAASGEIMYHQDNTKDTGRGIMANYNGRGYYQIWGIGTAYKDAEGFKDYDASGKLTDKNANFRIFWDGDVYDELMDGTGSENATLGINSGAGDEAGRIYTTKGVAINGTKNNPCLQADLFGDWREEVVVRNSDSSQLLIYTTTTETTNKLYTLMHDSGYRMQVAGQNSAYNQPPHISYYLSEDGNDDRETAAYVKTVHDGAETVRNENIPEAKNEYVPPITETAELIHTATSVWGSNTPATSCDNEKEHMNNDSESAWAGAAYAQFKLPEDDKFTSASFSFTVAGESRSDRKYSVYVADTDIDLTALTKSGADLYQDARTAISGTFTAPKGADGKYTVDVTDLVRERLGQTVTFIFTGNEGGGDLYGKASSKAPKLKLKYSASALDPTDEGYDITGYVTDGKLNCTITDTAKDKDITAYIAEYDSNGTLVKIKQEEAKGGKEIEDYVLMDITSTVKIFLWEDMRPVTDTIFERAVTAEDEPTATPGEEPTATPTTIPTEIPTDAPTEAPTQTLEPTSTPEPSTEYTTDIIIRFTDEEGNQIKDDIAVETGKMFHSGDRYTVPDEYQKDILIKPTADRGMYTYYAFNAGTSELTAKLTPETTIITLSFNGEQYDYYDDFEDITSTDNWKMASNSSAPTIESDRTKYIKHSTTTTSTGGYMTFDEVNTENKTVKITADVKFTKPTANAKLGQFAISNKNPSFSSNNIGYGIENSAGHIFALMYRDGTKLEFNKQTADIDFADQWIHIEADADFGQEKVTIKLTNENGDSWEGSQDFYSSTVESNIGSVYLRSPSTNGTVSIDNLTVKVTGDAVPAEPDIKSPLNYKSVYAFGDSIVYGHNAPVQSFMRLIANDYSIKLNMMAKNGATIMSGSNQILTQIKNAPSVSPDFVVFEGYTNDAYGSAANDPEFNPSGTQRDVTSCYGTIDPTKFDNFDTNTFCGAFENTIKTMKDKWGNDTKYVFVTIHESNARNHDIQIKLRELSMAACEKWGIEVVDMFTYVNDNGERLCTYGHSKKDAYMNKYIINGDGSHPTVEACEEFYIPAVVEVLEKLADK